MASYIPIGIFFLIALLIVPATMLIGWVLRPRRPTLTKMQPYECGIDVREPPRGRISIHFFIVAVVFLVFDVETIFLFPWALAFDSLGWFGFIEVMVFMALLIAAYAYAWMKGALRWEE